MTSATFPTWHPRPGKQPHHEVEILASAEDLAHGGCIAIVETFGYGWYANALPPQADGESSMIPGIIRGGNYGEHVEAAKAWCERICGLHPEKIGDRRSEAMISHEEERSR